MNFEVLHFKGQFVLKDSLYCLLFYLKRTVVCCLGIWLKRTFFRVVFQKDNGVLFWNVFKENST